MSAARPPTCRTDEPDTRRLFRV